MRGDEALNSQNGTVEESPHALVNRRVPVPITGMQKAQMRRPKVVVCDREESIIEERFKTRGRGSLWAGRDRTGTAMPCPYRCGLRRGRSGSFRPGPESPIPNLGNLRPHALVNRRVPVEITGMQKAQMRRTKVGRLRPTGIVIEEGSKPAPPKPESAALSKGDGERKPKRRGAHALQKSQSEGHPGCI